MTEPRRLLLIDWHFGNPAATGGARWRAMAAALVAEGWRFDVVTAGAPAATDGAGGQEGVRLFRVPVPTFADDALAALGRLKGALRRGAAAAPAPSAPGGAPPAAPPAPRTGLYARIARLVGGVRITLPEWLWTRRAVRRALQLADATRYHAVIVSSPPHLTQRAGARVARRLGLPYVADFRDPWVFGRPEKYDVNPLANPLGRLFEGPTLRQAALVVGNTGHARDAVAAIYPGLAARALAVTNGYDAGAVPAPGDPDRSRFRVVFAGWLYPFMDPECVLAAVGRLRARAGLTADELAVEFMGCDAQHQGVSLAALAAKHGLADCFQRYPHAPRAEAARLQSQAAVLVAFDASTQLAMPTKFYDYARMGGRMLLIGFPDGAMAAAAAQLGLKVYDPRDEAGMDAALDEALRRWRAGELSAPLDREGRFDRRLQSRRVNDALLSLRS